MTPTKPDHLRRTFIKKAAVGVAAFTIVPRYVLGGTGFIAPSDKLTKAVIGVGGMGRGHRVHQTFRGYWDYDGGGLSDMGQHYLDPVQYFLGKDGTNPVTVEVDAPQQHSDAVGTWRRITYTYADGCQIILDGDGTDDKAAYLEGPKGKLYPGFKSDIQDLEKKLTSFPEPAAQVTSFVDSVKIRKKFALNEENGHRSCNIVNIGLAALKLGRSLKFDPEKQVFVGDDAANKLINPVMRAPYDI